MTENKLIKVCGDPHCDAIFHNTQVKHTRCRDCGGRLIKINEDTYQRKFSHYKHITVAFTGFQKTVWQKNTRKGLSEILNGSTEPGNNESKTNES
jgi:ethanolamine utilization protein EutA (predicted chaperonin)